MEQHDQDTQMPDVDHPDDEQELDEKYPNRPRNHGRTLPFHDLFIELFTPLTDNKKKPAVATASRRKVGPHGSTGGLNAQDRRRDIIQRFISRWRKEVGDDIYPAFRLIVPDKDRDRAMYGLKEKVIGKLLVRIMKIDKNSEDGLNLLNWKLPGQSAASRMAGDFAGRCYEVLSKRPMRTEVGDMLIEEVNERLDQLSVASKEDQQLPILAEFYRRMNPEELMWLIRIILRQMKVGATERTFFDVWHTDAERLFSISSSLRRVCWELHDPNIRLEGDDRGVSLMQCFQPQLAQFQMHSFEKMVQRMRPTEEDPTFWIEEKLDGERLQLHMASDDSVEGGKRFCFWSRKAKDYTYLYGNGFYDPSGSLTRHLKDAFVDGVDNIILDGEMVTWDPEQDAPVPFGTLKTAALAEQRDPNSNGPRPLFRVFDILFLNDRDLTCYTLRDRRKALEKVIEPVHRRFEIHTYQEAAKASDIEPILRKVVEEASEGLVLKNPRSPYRLNERHDDWMKVKPEYMTEFGESLDLVVIGGYYGSGRRGGAISSYLCGLRVDDSSLPKGTMPMKCYSFCKVGGGLTAADYANIRHHTDGKWKPWNPKKPPSEFIELAGGETVQKERPDEWIRPDESVVICVKAASVSVSEEFRIGLTLRFPRFKRLRMDKDWKTALSVQEFLDLKSNVEREQREKQFTVENFRKKRIKTTTKKPLTVTGYDEDATVEYAGPVGNVFDGLNFFIMTDTQTPKKKTKVELEQLVKSNGGQIYQTHTAAPNMVCIGERRTVKVASLQKSGKENIIRPLWLFDCIQQNEADKNLPTLILPLEPKHMFFTKEDQQDNIAGNVDEYNDSYTRNTTIDELRSVLEEMKLDKMINDADNSILSERLFARFQELRSFTEGALPGWLFKGLTIYFHPSTISPSSPETEPESSQRLWLARSLAEFGGANISTHLEIGDNNDSSIKSSSSNREKTTKAGNNINTVTHVVVPISPSSKQDVTSLRKQLSKRVGERIPHIVSVEWVEESWREKTLVDEERFAPSR
ncbi:ATP-dependent DNA ligase IV [Talaromyces proteolyticus]|uniref:DNA ligase 4 n=1 Tax=Talaromyces proteolyticus TaxID=1131652 RepID=A0AAD4L0Y9_9EURO|nr:ATP-dependent DNA ligase IV [Talaromyces proteolyticus]KAH8705089.1 ATP-dependent DNA ligase IV [Talaromyces proteolyticus]